MPAIPKDLRAAVSDQLARLVRGDFPDLLIWVTNYGPNGATLVAQPDAIFDHPRSDAVATPDGGWHVVVPLFTVDESPSDLSAEIVVEPTGEARLTDVHVL
jgi:hypothetical protein